MSDERDGEEREDFSGDRWHFGKWHRLLVASGWTPALPVGAKDVLMALAGHANMRAETFVGAATLGDEVGLHPDSVRRWLRELFLKHHLIEKAIVEDKNGRERAGWRILVPPPAPAKWSGRRGKVSNLNKDKDDEPRHNVSESAPGRASTQTVDSDTECRSETTHSVGITICKNAPRNCSVAGATAAVADGFLLLPIPRPAVADQVPEPDVVRDLADLYYARLKREVDPEKHDLHCAPPGFLQRDDETEGECDVRWLVAWHKYRDVCSAVRLVEAGAHELAWRVLCRPSDAGLMTPDDGQSAAVAPVVVVVQQARKLLGDIARALPSRYAHEPELLRAVVDVIDAELSDCRDAEGYLETRRAEYDERGGARSVVDPRPISAMNCVAYGPGSLWTDQLDSPVTGTDEEPE